MTTLISNANGNLTGAATFAAAELGAGAFQPVRFNNNSSFAAAQSATSPAFTITSGKVIDGVVLWVKQDGSVVSNGTFKVDLQKGGVSQASVTVNKTDLPTNTGGTGTNLNSPMFFKFTGTATGDGAANWTLVLTTTGTAGVVYASLRQNLATDLTRIFRTTTAQTPAAGDDLYITGELTGAGTHNSITVTMNSTAATVYGNGTLNSTTVAGGMIAVSCYGTLTYGIAASTNYILRVNGDLRVHYSGTLNIGSAGAEIPRTSTAVLEFQPVSASGDFGLSAYEGSVVNIAGLSRTSGKNVNKCKLISDVVSSNVYTTSAVAAVTNSLVQLDATGTSLLGAGANETTANSPHSVTFTGSSVTNVTQTAVAWIAQGAGPSNNRYVRFQVGNATTLAAITNGFYSDLDLQAGTAGTVTAVGTGTATSVSIAAQGAGWLVKMTGKVASTAAIPTLHIAACSAPGTTSYTGVASNQNFLYDHVALVNVGSISDTTFNVDTDTGWLNGDVVCVASTSRSGIESTLHILNANAGASSFTSPLYSNNVQVPASAYTHSGTAPTQAEIGLITRNVKIRSTSPTLVSYFYGAALATVTASWAEFSRMGTSTVSKRGIEMDSAAVANPKSFTYCCVHDFPSNGFFTAAGFASFNAVYSNNVNWFTGQSITVNSTVTNGDFTFDNNLVMRPNTYGFVLSDVGGTVTNNTACGVTSLYGFWLGENNGVIGTFSNNTAHSCNTGGLNLASAGMVGVINNYTGWRIGSTNGGFNIATDNPDVVFVNPVLFGNITYNISLISGDLTIVGGTLAGDTLFSTTNGIWITGGSSRIRLDSVDMSGTGTGLVPHTGVDLFFNTSPAVSQVKANNCKFGAPNVFLKTNWSNTAYIGFEKYNGVAGDHRCEMRYGQTRTDTTIYHTAAPSMRMTPNNATNKLESAPDTHGVKVPVANGNSVNVSVSLRTSAYLIDSALYNGNAPRLIQRANAALGQLNDVVLATFAGPTAAVAATLDPATIALTTLSSGNLVITSAGTTTNEQGGKVAPQAVKTAGKHYFEVTMTTFAQTGGIGGASCSIGIALSTSTYTQQGGSLAQFGASVHVGAANAPIYISPGNFTGYALQPRLQGDKIGVAVDLDNRQAWFRVLPSGLWNNDATANPATNVNGVAILSGAVVPYITFGGVSGPNGQVFTVNFGGSAFAGTVPSGFAAGWLVPTGTGAWASLSGTSSVATDDGIWEFVVDCDGTNGWINADDWTFSGVATTASGLANWYEGVPQVGLFGISGALNATQANQTLVATGGPVVAGTLTVTQANETLVAVGSVIVRGTLTVTQAAQTLSATCSVIVDGRLIVNQNDQTLVASGTVGTVSFGSLIITQDNQTLAAAGKVAVAGTLIATQANETLSATGTVFTGASLARTQANQTLVAAGKVVVAGTLVATQADETLNATGRAGVAGALIITQGNETLSATGETVVLGSLTRTQANQTLDASAIIGQFINGSLIITQADQTFVGTGAVVVGGALAQTQAPQTFTGAGVVVVGSALTQTQASQTLAAAGRVAVAGALAETQADETLVAVGGQVATGALVKTQADETLVAAGRVIVAGVLTVAQANETLVAAGASVVTGDLTITQAPQVLAGAGGTSVIASLTVTQADQTLAAQKYKVLQVMPLYGRRGILVLDGDASQITPLTGHRSGIELEGDASQIMSLRGRRSGMNLQGSAS